MPTASSASSREILTGLHDVMASKASAQAKLNKVVKIIAEAMASEVCSIYLLRDGDLELFATFGLNQSAVHITKLALGEGLVGTIAKEVSILNLDEAASHPEFAYRPETGEELFHSFAGVPIIRKERSIGVLAVQHADPRGYDEIEIEALQTVGMVLSELIANAGLADKAATAGAENREAGMARLTGLKLVTGMGRGIAVYHQPRILIEHTVAEDVEAERHRVYSAFAKMREQIDAMTGQAEFGTVGEHQEVLETYKMFAYDEGWSRRINEAIDSGLTAEAAIERVRQRMAQRMRQIDDALLADRMHDLDDLSNRLLRIVSGQLGTAAAGGMPQDAILIARNLGPAELLEYDRRKLKGVILEEGSLTAHVTIVARAMGVPMLGRVRDVRRMIAEGDQVLLDGGEAVVFARPTAAIEDAFEARMLASQKRRAEFAAARDLPPLTKDGTRITLMVNAGLRDDVAALGATGADGIGLFRTEFQFLVSAASAQARGADPALSLGARRRRRQAGDLPHRRYRRRQAIALSQRRRRPRGEPGNGLAGASSRARPGHLDEGAGARPSRSGGGARARHHVPDGFRALGVRRRQGAWSKAQRAWLAERRKRLPTKVRYGAMLEVPALAEVLDILLPKLDFMSIGTNDLTQFLFAADRSNPALAERYDWLSPAILRFLKRVVSAADAHKVPLAVCGEMGGRTLEALALIGIGITRLSITPVAVGPIKAMIRSLDRGAAQRPARRIACRAAARHARRPGRLGRERKAVQIA